MGQTYDVVVLGVGGFGSSALLHLAQRGLRVLGIERFRVPHDRGSSHGETRIIRKAYFEHPDYVPLLQRSYQLWRQLEQDAGRQLLFPAGLMLIGPPQAECITGARLSARLHTLTIEEWTPDEARQRCPGFCFADSDVIVFEPEAGYLTVEDCVQSHAERAVQLGAVLQTDELVTGWSSDGQTVRVQSDRDQYEARFLVVTAGPWASQLLADLSLPLEVVRKVLTWHRTRTADYEASAGTPTYYYELPTGHFYGFPSIDGQTVKVAEHSGGQPVIDPLAVDRRLLAGDVQPLADFVTRMLPGVDPTPERHSVCLYTLTPDRHFIVDRHPVWSNVVLGAGFSGHGFKFTPVIGEALAELIVNGGTHHPIDFLRLNRPSLGP